MGNELILFETADKEIKRLLDEVGVDMVTTEYYFE